MRQGKTYSSKNMKKLFLMTSLCLLSIAAMAEKVTTTTTTTVYGKNTGTTTTGTTTTINCDNFWSWECYTTTTTTTTETKINHGDPITVTVFDENGRNPRIALEGYFDWVEESRNENLLTVTFAILE